MLCFFLALQAMTPFIHAHAGAVPLNHANFLHLHQGVHGDAAYHVIAAVEHGAEIKVAQGMPLRNGTLGAAAAPLAVPLALPGADKTERPGAGLSPSPLYLAPPDHTLPHTLAPPSV